MAKLTAILLLLSMGSLATAQTASVAGFFVGGKALIKITGPIDEKTSQAFTNLFTSWGETPREIEIYLNSGGGQSAEGWKMIELLEEQKQKGAHITTMVKNGNICGSLCVPIYVQGHVRKAGTASSFMFHSASKSFAGLFSVMNLPAENEKVSRIFLKAGVSKKWLDRLLAEEKIFESAEYYWISGRELFDEKSGIVTEPVSHRDEAVRLGGVKLPF